MQTREILGFHIRTAYLSLTYFDRFNSRRPIDVSLVYFTICMLLKFLGQTCFDQNLDHLRFSLVNKLLPFLVVMLINVVCDEFVSKVEMVSINFEAEIVCLT